MPSVLWTLKRPSFYLSGQSWCCVVLCPLIERRLSLPPIPQPKTIAVHYLPQMRSSPLKGRSYGYAMQNAPHVPLVQRAFPWCQTDASTCGWHGIASASEQARGLPIHCYTLICLTFDVLQGIHKEFTFESLDQISTDAILGELWFLVETDALTLRVAVVDASEGEFSDSINCIPPKALCVQIELRIATTRSSSTKQAL